MLGPNVIEIGHAFIGVKISAPKYVIPTILNLYGNFSTKD